MSLHTPAGVVSHFVFVIRVGRLPFIYSRRDTNSKYTEHHAGEKVGKPEIHYRRRRRRTRPTRPPPWGGAPKPSSGVAAQARGKTTVAAVDSRAARYKNCSKPSSEATPPGVAGMSRDKIIPAEVAADEAQVAILRAKQEEYWDNVAERNNVNIFINSTNLRLRYSTAGKTVLDPPLVGKTKIKLALARIRKAFLAEEVPKSQKNCEKAHAAITGNSTSSVGTDPDDRNTNSFTTKFNKWLQPDAEEIDDPSSTAESESGSSSGSSDSSEESTSGNNSVASVSDEVRQQRIINIQNFYVRNRARWMRGELDEETWEQFGAPEDSPYFND